MIQDRHRVLQENKFGTKYKQNLFKILQLKSLNLLGIDKNQNLDMEVSFLALPDAQNRLKVAQDRFRPQTRYYIRLQTC